MGFIKEHKEKIKEAIFKIFHSIGENTEVTYVEDEDGPGFCVQFTNSRTSFSYLEKYDPDIDSFFDDITTDAAFCLLDAEYNVITDLNWGKGEHLLSLPDGLIKGHKILAKFWNPKTCIFDWDAFLIARQAIKSDEFDYTTPCTLANPRFFTPTERTRLHDHVPTEKYPKGTQVLPL